MDYDLVWLSYIFFLFGFIEFFFSFYMIWINDKVVLIRLIIIVWGYIIEFMLDLIKFRMFEKIKIKIFLKLRKVWWLNKLWKIEYMGERGEIKRN